ncbi:hypothetical protein IJ182_10655 [bacterium]|nr:hypothetical protein [bacterium]
MKKLFIILLLILGIPTFCKTINGEITKQSKKDTNQIYDAQTNLPLENVIVKIPSKNYYTKTKKDGSFKLQTQINAPTIMALEKNGYKPYSMTIGTNLNSPINIGIEKTTPKDIIVETDMVHIGDDSFSKKSANANDFCLKSVGAFYTKDFNVKNINKSENLFLIIGSIIGIDTLEAQRLGQSGVLTAYSSPPELYFNGNKISDIKINGDNQRIKIPSELVKQNQINNVTLKTGHNLYKVSSIDYDDIEFTNLMFEIK